jgi:hypothetical protein
MQPRPARDPLSTASLDYLQRSGFSPLPLASRPSEYGVTPRARRMTRVIGVGALEKGVVLGAGEAALGQTAGILSGLHGYGLPLAFQVRTIGSGVRVSLGTWSIQDDRGDVAATADVRLDIMSGLLRAAYPAVFLGPPDQETAPSANTWAGFALGVPTAHPPDPRDGALGVDRLIRATAGGEWSVVVLAEPVGEGRLSALRAGVINEMRAVQAASQSTGAPSPLAQHYTVLLQATLETLTHGGAVGAWRVAVYLTGDASSYPRLAAAWRGIFSGAASLPEPLRTWDSTAAAALAAGWMMPDLPAPEGPGYYRHPFLQQTLLNSSQLAAITHLPQQESTGFSITIVPEFDVVSRTVGDGENQLELGKVLERTRRTDTPYRLSIQDLTRHAFVAGVTGSGKTNSIFHMLHQVDAARVPFLVLEPAKTEYRSLLGEPAFRDRLAVFTLGEERTSPLRLNPFEVLPGTSVAQHLDLLRSVFQASFGMWTPLPQVLERCLHLVYEEQGWDVATNSNRRLDAASPAWLAFPTLSHLVDAVNRVTPALGYEERVTADIRAALLTRLNSLRSGGKGRMLDVQRSTPMSVLLAGPVVLELEPMSDDDDKAFVMGLLLIRLAQLRRAEGSTPGLRHLLVIEEAHRLLSAVQAPRSEEEADPRAKAVEAFGQLLAEIRAYGQGVLAADQVPVRLAPDVIKNTNLKLAHRVVAADDRAVLAASMAMTGPQARSVAILSVGQAAIFADGDDAPVLVQVPRAKTGDAGPKDADVAQRMRRWRQEVLGQAGLAPYSDCELQCPDDNGLTCGLVRRMLDDSGLQRTLSRLIQSSMEDPEALERLWPDLVAEVAPHRPAGVDERSLLCSLAVHASRRLADRRGGQSGWSYAATDAYARALREMLLDRANGAAGAAAAQSHRRVALDLHARTFPPFQACDVVCRQQPPVCLYRHAVADYIASGEQAEAWRRADVADAVSGPDRQQRSWEVALDAAYALIEFPEEDWPEALRRRVSDAARRVALCFSQQMLDRDTLKSPRTTRRITRKLLREAAR